MPIEPPPPGTSLVVDNDLFQDWRFSQPYILAEIRDYQSRLKMLPALTSMTVFEALGGLRMWKSRAPFLMNARSWPAMPLNN
jgi:hypothetical protein